MNANAKILSHCGPDGRDQSMRKRYVASTVTPQYLGGCLAMARRGTCEACGGTKVVYPLVLDGGSSDDSVALVGKVCEGRLRRYRDFVLARSRVNRHDAYVSLGLYAEYQTYGAILDGKTIDPDEPRSEEEDEPTAEDLAFIASDDDLDNDELFSDGDYEE